MVKREDYSWLKLELRGDIDDNLLRELISHDNRGALDAILKLNVINQEVFAMLFTHSVRSNSPKCLEMLFQHATPSTTCSLVGLLYDLVDEVIARDYDALLSLFIDQGILACRDHYSLLQSAVTSTAIKCTEHLTRAMCKLQMPANTQHKPDDDLFAMAHRRGAAFIKALLTVGYTYSEQFFLEHPHMLSDYYRNIGITTGKIEQSCAEFTVMVLTTHHGSPILHHKLTGDLIDELFSRFTYFIRHSSQHTEENYYRNLIRDLTGTVEEILKHKPEVLLQLSPDFLQTLIFSAQYITQMSSSVDSDFLHWFTQLVLFLMSNGCAVNKRLLDTMIYFITLPTKTKSSAVLDIKPIVCSKCELLDTTIQLAGLDSTAKAGIFFKFLTAINVKSYGNMSPLTPNDHDNGIRAVNLSLFTHGINLLYANQLDIYDLPLCDPDVSPNSPQDLVVRGSLLHRLSSTIFHMLLSSSRTSSDIPRYLPSLELLVFFISQRVDFEREKQDPVGYRRMFDNLVSIITYDNWHYINDITLRLTFKLLRYMLVLMFPACRRDTARNVLHQINLPTPRCRGDCRACDDNRRHFDQLVQEVLLPLLGVPSLVDISVLAVRKYLLMCRTKFKHTPYAISEWIQLRNLESRENEPKYVFGSLAEKSFCVNGVDTLAVKAEQLSIPVELKELVIGERDMEYTIKELWSVASDNSFMYSTHLSD